MTLDPFVFDPETGCVGRIQLVRRWVMFGAGAVWPRRHACFTYESEQIARLHTSLCLACVPDQVPSDLHACPFWVWPQNGWPAYPIDSLT